MKFRHVFRATLCCAVAFPLACLAAETSFEEGAVAHLKEVTRGDTSGMAVLVARDGKILYQGGFGFADVAERAVVTPETKFRIGSISKQFTAAAIARLADEGKLALDDSLAKFL